MLCDDLEERNRVEGELKMERIDVYKWLSHFAGSPETILILLTGYTSITK